MLKNWMSNSVDPDETPILAVEELMDILEFEDKGKVTQYFG